MKKIYHSQQQIEGACLSIIKQMQAENWKPDYIVGITRGGLVPANLISQFLDIQLETLKVSLRDHKESETNCWMSEDAYAGKKILIVDDINDTGATIAWIKKDWQSTCLPDDPIWNNIWGNNVRIATITDNLSSKETVDYSHWEINKAENDVWIVYPWETWWAPGA
jgi:hypoxanthine phosphoribosyltransferase